MTMNESVRCECGARLFKKYVNDHLKTARHRNLMADPHYYDREQILQRRMDQGKKYYDAHKDEQLEKSQKWKEEHRERYIELRKQYSQTKISCECGVEVSKNHYSEHLKTKKHKEWMTKGGEMVMNAA